MKFNADEIASVIQAEIVKYESTIDVREVGTVLEVGDGIARVYGLSNIMAGEMVEFPNGVNGLAFNLEENSVGVIILGFLQIQLSLGSAGTGDEKTQQLPNAEIRQTRLHDFIDGGLNGLGQRCGLW